MKFWSALLISLSITSEALAGSTPFFSESLKVALDKGNVTSPLLKSTQAGAEAAQLAYSASFTKLLPALSLEGDYFYQTNVPAINFPGLGSFTAGANSNYTIGPVLRYTVFDGIQSYKNHQSADFSAQSKRESLKANQRDLALNVKLAYFQTQLALKNLMTTTDALKLAQAQSHDIDLRFEAGSSSKLDQYSARRDVMNYQLKFQQAQADLAATLRNLFALTGENSDLDVSAPVPQDLAGKLPVGVTLPSLYLQFDRQEESFQELTDALDSTPPDRSQPQVKALVLSAQASELSAQAQQGSVWPKLDLSIKSQLLYPNVIVPSQAWNNTFMISLNFPLWLGDASWDIAKQKSKEALSARYQSDQKLSDLNRDYLKALDLAKNLQRQQKSNLQLIDQTEQIARLTYQSYKAGKVNYLDVQTANQRLLEARLASTQTDEQLLTQLATLTYLSSPQGEHRE